MQMLLFVASLVTTAMAAFAYSKNLSGYWTTPEGWKVLVTHRPDVGRATFRATIDMDATGKRALAFTGRVTDDPIDSGYFWFSGDASAFDVVVRGKVCNCMPSFGMKGALVGDVGGRRMHAPACSVNLLILCDSENVPDYIQFPCDGVWR